VRHLCRVASGLESFVLGEHEIAGQVSRAFKSAVRSGGGPRVLDGVAAVARRASRRVRSETGIGRYAASVSSVAVDLARERLGELTASRAVVVGAGKASLLVARALRSAGVASLVVANRSLQRGRAVAAQVGGAAAELHGLPTLLAEADLVVTATGAGGVIIGPEMVAHVVGVRGPDAKPLLVLDLALPGDVDPGVGAIPGFELLTLEDVKERVHRHLSFRRDELDAAERVVAEVVDDFLREQERPDVDGLIGELRRSVEAVRSAEVDRWLMARGSEAPPSREELDRLTRAIVNKILHRPMQELRALPLGDARSRLLVSAARELAGVEAAGLGDSAGG
jgi:glutamyl-tRNA reductase